MRTDLSSLLLSRRELRFVTRGMVRLGLVGALAVGAWLSPLSPGPMMHAGDLAAAGQVDAAIEVYLHAAQSHLLPSTRREAHWAAASLASVDTTRPQRAIGLLRDFILQHPGHLESAQASARLGTLYLLYQHDPVRAAEAWGQAVAIAPQDPQAGQWLLDAGLVLSDAGLNDQGLAQLQRATQHPTQAFAAHFAMGRMTMALDPATAYGHYSAATRAATEEADQNLARLGAASALEALDRVDQAVAELSAVDSDQPELQRRRARLLAIDNP